MTFDLTRVGLFCILNMYAARARMHACTHARKRWGCTCIVLSCTIRLGLRNFWRAFTTSVALLTANEAVQGLSVVSATWRWLSAWACFFWSIPPGHWLWWKSKHFVCTDFPSPPSSTTLHWWYSLASYCLDPPLGVAHKMYRSKETSGRHFAWDVIKIWTVRLSNYVLFILVCLQSLFWWYRDLWLTKYPLQWIRCGCKTYW